VLEPDDLPLAGIVVLDFSQFLAGPVAALRLADLGARVIKVERPVTGEIGRTLAFAGRWADGDTLSFHAMNRNKEAVVADLKNPGDLARVKELVARADVLIQNFRPGVMERIGLDAASALALNPGLVYASASGYGVTGPWSTRPGQDLLAQSVSALPWASATADRPVPVGLAIADHLMSCHIAEGVTALLVRRARTGRGGVVETSLLEAMVDLQFERITARLNASGTDARVVQTVAGIWATADGHLAVSNAPTDVLAALTRSEPLSFTAATTEHWLDALDAAGLDAAPVLTLEQMLAHPAFAAVRMTQTVERPASVPGGAPVRLTTTRSPMRIDGEVLTDGRAAPRLGAQGHLRDCADPLADRSVPERGDATGGRCTS
jgi:CoA:oxalate CoA-transferase